MSRDDELRTTRRKWLAASGALAASGLLAGCTGGQGSETTTTEETTTTAETTTEETETETETEESDGESYTVSMEPVGEVTFDSVPQTWVANNGSWADMGVALGVEPPEALWLTSRYHTQYYDGIDGVSVDKSDMVDLSRSGEVDKELFYELDADVHVIDPNFLLNRFPNWEQADIDEIAEGVGPFFGNSIFSRQYAWHDDYRYYTLLEAFEKLAQVFQRTDRYEAFAQLHEEFQSKVDDVVPPEDERPEVAITWAGGDDIDKPEQFYPYVISEGTSFKQWNDLKVNDAFAQTDVKDFHSDRGAIDYETLLDVDPEVLLVRGHEDKTEEEFRGTVVSFMEDHNVASNLTAVQNGDVYRGGSLYQGPITNLVLTERAARQLYDVEEELFDRQRVSDIVNGNF